MHAAAIKAPPAGGVADTEVELDVLHHIAVQVGDIGKAVAWYRAHMCCEVEYQDATWAMLKLRNTRLALVVSQQHPPHLAVLRADAARFGPLRRHRDGTASCYVADPDGNMLELMEDPQ